jgi:hypothetical protein
VDVEILAGINRDGVAVGEVVQAFRKLLDPRHRAPQDQNRDHRAVFAQRDLDLDAHRVGGVGEPALPGARADPARPDDRENDIACIQNVGDELAEVDAGRNVVDVAEYHLPAVMRRQPVEDPPGDHLRIIAAIGDRVPRHQSGSGPCSGHRAPGRAISPA